MRYWALVLGLSLPLSRSSAFGQDAEGCKDSPLIQRMPGSTISTCEHKEFDSVEILVGKHEDGDPATKNIEGEVWSWSMGNREGLSDVQA
jgi:OmpA-OmpF porin, OOP family